MINSDVAGGGHGQNRTRSSMLYVVFRGMHADRERVHVFCPQPCFVSSGIVGTMI